MPIFFLNRLSKLKHFMQLERLVQIEHAPTGHHTSTPLYYIAREHNYVIAGVLLRTQGSTVWSCFDATSTVGQEQACFDRTLQSLQSCVKTLQAVQIDNMKLPIFQEMKL